MKEHASFKKLLKPIVALMIMAYLVVACGATRLDARAAEATGISLNKTSATIYIGSTLQLKVSGTTATVTWSSNNTKVATVSGKGLVTPKAEGTATITAKVSGKKLTCKVTVKKPFITPETATIYTNQTKTLKLTGTDIKSAKSSSTSVATVTAKGVVTGKKAGTATITLTGTDKKTYKCKVTVKSPYLNTESASIYVNQTVTLKLTGATAASFASSDGKVASVSSKGVVSAKKAGTATITVTDSNKKTYKCKVTVKNPYLNKTSLSLDINKSFTLTLTGATAASFASSNTSVATVTNKGVITGKKAGTATITVTDSNKATYKCTVTVKACTSHKWDSGKVTKEASCTAGGSKLYTCTVCKTTKTETIAAKGHKFTDGVCENCDLVCTHENYVKQTSGKRKGYFVCDVCGSEPEYTQIKIGENSFDWSDPAFRNRADIWDDEAKTELSATFRNPVNEGEASGDDSATGDVSATDDGQEYTYYEIVGICNQGFQGSFSLDGFGTTLVLPSSVRTIGANAFGGSKHWTKIVIPEGVTQIEENTFACSKVEEVILPSTITSIGYGAFAMSSLSAIELNEGLETIVQGAFTMTRSLTDIEMPSTLTTLGGGAFCASGLKNVSLAKATSLTEISEGAFSDCTNLESVVLNEGLETIGAKAFEISDHAPVDNEDTISADTNSEDSKSTGTNSDITESAEVNTKIKKLVIPDSVTSVEALAFSGRAFEEITVGQGITDAESLNNIIAGSTDTLKEGGLKLADATLLEADTFNGKPCTILASGSTNVTADVYSKMTHTFGEDGTCTNCGFSCDHTSFVKITEGERKGYYRCLCGEKEPEYTDISIENKSKDHTFYWERLQLIDDIWLDDAKTELSATFREKSSENDDDYNYYKITAVAAGGFSGETGEDIGTTIILPDSIKTIGASFSGTNHWKKVVFSDGITEIASGCFFESSVEEVVLSSTVTSLAMSAFSSSSVVNIELNEGLETIGRQAFSGSLALTNIKLPSTVTTIGSGAFSNCISLSSITLNEGLETISGGAFHIGVTEGTIVQVKEMVIPDSVTTLDRQAFLGRTFEKITFGSGVKNKESLNVIIAANANTLVTGGLKLADASLLNAETLSGKPCTLMATSYANVNEAAYRKMTHTLNEIGTCTNCGLTCDHTSFVKITEGPRKGYYRCLCGEKEPEYEQIGIGPQDNDRKINIFDWRKSDFREMLEWDDEAKTMLSPTFKGNSSKLAGTEDDKYYEIVRLYTGAFSSSDGMDDLGDTLILPASVAGSIGQYAFQNCKIWKKVVLPEGVKSISRYTFAGSDIEEVYVPSTVTLIDGYAFAASKIKTISLPEGLTTIEDGAFVSTPNLKSIEIPSTVTSIGYIAFASSNIESIKVPSGVKNINQTFSSCDNLSSITIADGVETIAGGAFSLSNGAVNKVKELTIPDSVKEVKTGAFYGRSFEKIHIGKNVPKDNVTYLINKSAGTLKKGGLYLANTANVADDALTNISCEVLDLAAITGNESFLSKMTHSFDTEGKCTYCGFGCDHTSFVKITEGPRKGYYRCLCGEKEPEYEQICIGYQDNDKKANIFDWRNSDFREMVEWDDEAKTMLSPTFKGDSAKLEGTEDDKYYEIVGLYSGAFANSAVIDDIGDTLILPASIKDIYSSGAFANSSTWKKIVLPEGITSINESMFVESTVEEVIIPSTVTKICTAAFLSSQIKAINLPEGLTTIGSHAFASASNLKSVVLPSTVTSIDYNSFYNSGLESVDTTKVKALETIGQNAFYGTNIKSFIIPSSVTTIEKYAFCETKLESIVIHSKVKAIGEGAFFGCENLASIKMEEGLEEIGSCAFATRNIPNKVRELTIPDSVKNVTQNSLWGLNLEKLHIGKNVPEDTVTALISMNKGTLKKGGLYLGNTANVRVGVMTSVSCEILDIASITGKEAFIPAMTHSLDSEGKCTYCGFTCQHNYVKQTSGERKGYYLCDSCGQEPTYIKLTVGIDPGTGKASEDYKWSSENFRNLVEWEDEAKTILSPTCKKTNTNLDGSVEEYYYEIVAIGAGGFAGTETAEVGDNLVLPSSVKSVGDGAFNGSVQWKKVVFLEGITQISDYCFQNSKLEIISLPSTIESIGKEAFSGSTLKNIYFNDGLTSIGNSAFQNTANLTSVEMPSGLETIGTSLFYQSGVKSVSFENATKLKEIPRSTFNGSKLEEFTFNNSITAIGDFAFASTNITSVEVPASVKTIGDWAFYDAVNLESVTFNEGLQSIGECVFAMASGNSSKIKALFIPDSVTSVQNDLTSYSKLEKLSIGEGITDGNTISSLVRCVANTLIANGLTLAKPSLLADSILSGKDCAIVNSSNLTGSESFLAKMVHSEFENGACKHCKFRCAHSMTITKDTQATCTADGEYSAYCTKCGHIESEVRKATGHKTSDTWSYNANLHWLEYVCADKASLAAEKKAHIWDDDTCTVCGYKKAGDCEECSYERITRGERKGYFECSVCGKEPEYVNLSSLDLSQGINVGSYGFIIAKEDDSHIYPSFKGENDTAKIFNSETYYILDTIPKGFFKNHSFSSTSGKLILPATVTSLGKSAFEGISGIGEVVLPDGITSIADSLFKSASINEITIPSSVKTIGEYALASTPITTIVVPQSVETLCEGAFYSCSSLASVTLNEGLKTVKSSVFSSCRDLEEIIFPDSVETLEGESGEEVINWCGSLKKVYLGTGLLSAKFVIGNGCGEIEEGGITIACDPSVLAYDNSTWTFSWNSTHCTMIKDLENYSAYGPKYWGAYHWFEDGECTYCNYECTHSYSSYSSTENPTCTEAGKNYYFCYDCQDSYYETIPSTGHMKYKAYGHDEARHWINYYCEHAESLDKEEANHSFDSNGVCSVCKFVCNHDVSKSCDNCGYEAPQKSFSIGTIEDFLLVMGYESEADIPEELTIPATFSRNEVEYSILSVSMGELVDRGIKKLTLSEGIVSAWGAYIDENDIEEVYFPSTIRGIPSFSNCPNLKKVVIPSSAPLTYLKSELFMDCTGLEEFTIPDAVTEIYENAFSGAKIASGIVIGPNVTCVESDAFVSFVGNITVNCDLLALRDYSFSSVKCSQITNVEEISTSFGFAPGIETSFWSLGIVHDEENSDYCKYCRNYFGSCD